MNHRARVIILWFGSIDGHGTIGDLMSVQAACQALSRGGFDVECASWTSVGEFTVRPGAEVEPSDYAVAVFVCGPIMREHEQLASLFEKFKEIPLVGVGVSLFPESHWNYVNPFVAVLAREGGVVDWHDIALAAPFPTPPASPHPRGVPLTVGLSLRGPQGEYGSENCLAAKAALLTDEVVTQLSEQQPIKVVRIEHRLSESALSPIEIEGAYASCDLILTTRLHGALLSMRHRTPFVAMDQIAGGAKVTSVLRDSGWPFVFAVDSLDGQRLLEAAHQAMSTPSVQLLSTVSIEAEKRARVTLEALLRIVSRIGVMR